ncbi:YraN family protein [Desulfomonile tiedjei]|nr:YraN family protein [Desulfomonile tiedjei]
MSGIDCFESAAGMTKIPKQGILGKLLSREDKGSPTRRKGTKAEVLAAKHLQDIGYRILETNFECSLGEIDIIARQGSDLVFIEVRSRSLASSLSPVVSINRRKRNKVVQVAQAYLDRRYRQPPPCRFDVVLVTVGPPTEIEVIPDAFGAQFF